MTHPHKNSLRASLRPLDAPTLALTSLGLGFLRPAPGTWGSLPPPALAFLMLTLGASPRALDLALGGLLIVSSALCVALGRHAETRFGRKDAAEVVLDETAGQCLPLMLLPWDPILDRAGDPAAPVRALIAGAVCFIAFSLFRACDILKPWPARRLEALPHGWGVLADDLIAGAYAAIALHLALRLV